MKSQGNITEEDVMGVVDLFTRVPALLLKMAVFKNMNVVKKFESQIVGYKDQLSDGDMVNIKRVMEMPVPELQEMLSRVHSKTGHKQLEILADPRAEPFIKDNFRELKALLFNQL